MDLKILQGVCKILVLFAQGDVLSFDPLEILDSHLELVLEVLHLAFVVESLLLQFLLNFLLITGSSWRLALSLS